MTTPGPPPSSHQKPQDSNAKYVVLGLVLLLGIVGIALWRFLAQPPPPPPQPLAIKSAPPPPPPKFDDVPPPPPEEDAGPETGPRWVGPAIKPCDVAACSGAVTPDTEATLGILAKQTRRKCYEPVLATDPELRGDVAIKIKIAANGDICSAFVDTADPGLQHVGECTARIIAAAGHVPAPRGCVNVKFPLQYKPQSAK